MDVAPGELFGLIGPDGAGKTSLMRIVTTLLLPDRGSVSIDNLDVVENYKTIRRLIGYMPGRFSLYQDLSVEENLHFFATVFGTTVDANYELIRDIYQQIEPFKKRRAGKLSGGMKQKLALSCALIHKPRLLILDEPTTGVDAVSRKEFWEMLKKLQHKKITIVVSTPYMDEAALCDRVALIQNGKILDIDAPARITGKYQQKLFQVEGGNMYLLIHKLRQHPQVDTAFAFGQSVHVTPSIDQLTPEELVQYLHGEGIPNATARPIQPQIEDVFMAMQQLQTKEARAEKPSLNDKK